MTNAEIIMGEKILNEIDVDLEVHTYSKWKQLGYIVKKGEKAIISTKLWKLTNNKKEAEDEESDGEETKTLYSKMRLCKAYLFSINQVEKLKEA